jgi:hypothetical protein
LGINGSSSSINDDLILASFAVIGVHQLVHLAVVYNKAFGREHRQLAGNFARRAEGGQQGKWRYPCESEQAAEQACQTLTER